jgi:hypothetical protein
MSVDDTGELWHLRGGSRLSLTALDRTKGFLHGTLFTMGIKAFVIATLAAVAVAKPIPDPLNVMRQSGPAAGVVRTFSKALSSC